MRFEILFLLFAVHCLADPIYLRRTFPNITSILGSQVFTVRSSFTNTTNTFRVTADKKYDWNILVEFNGHNESVMFKHTGFYEVAPTHPFYKVNTTYTVTISNISLIDAPQRVGISYDEGEPNAFATLSDNEIMPLDCTVIPDGDIYIRYNTQARFVHTVTAVYIQIYTNGYYETAQAIYVGTHEYPIPSNQNTYYWSSTNLPQHKVTSLTITNNDPHFCGNECSYFITAVAPSNASFSLMANATLDVRTLEANTPHSFAVSPESSTYLQLYIEKSLERYTGLNFVFNVTAAQPYDLKDPGLSVFVNAEEFPVHPGNAMWERRTSNVSFNGSFTIWSNDPRFCTGCKYYIRIDASPDQFIPLIGNIQYTVKHDFHPTFILPDRYYRGEFVGNNTNEHRDIAIRIPKDNETVHTIVETIQISYIYDEFVEETISLEIQNYYPGEPQPEGCPEQHWKANIINGSYSLYLTREDQGFCTGIVYYVITNLTKAEGRELNFVIFVHYDAKLFEVNDGVPIYGQLTPYTEGQFFFYNFSKIDLDTDITFTATLITNEPLYLYVSLTSFKDGNTTAEWVVPVAAKLPGVVFVNHSQSLYKTEGFYYIRVDHQDDYYGYNSQFELTVQYSKPKLNQLNPGASQSTFSRQSYREGYMYFGLDSTSIEGSMGYSFNYTKSIPFDSVLYISNVTYPRPNFHLYDYRFQVLSRETTFSFDLTRDQPGYCDKCIIYFSIFLPKTINAIFHIRATTLVNPIALRPNELYRGEIKGNSGAQLFTLSYASQGKKPDMSLFLGNKPSTPDLYLAVSTSVRAPNMDSSDWASQTLPIYNSTIALNKDNSHYVDGGPFYVAVGPLVLSEWTSPFELLWSCKDGMCGQCENPNFDVTKECKDCIPYYYGEKCEKKCQCSHGTCTSGIHGDGRCNCMTGWALPICAECQDGYYGLSCQKCTVDCNGYGTCKQTTHGDGTCECTHMGLDPRTNCASCNPGYFSTGCHQVCPGGASAPCHSNGQCDDGWEGKGRCSCFTGYFGLDCSTNSTTTKCKPHCVPGHGACDEENGLCVCWEGWSGNTCNQSHHGLDSAIMIGIACGALGGIGILGIAFFFLYKYLNKPRAKKGSLDISAQHYNLLDDI